MREKNCCRYYVFDKYKNEFIKENGELATVSEEFMDGMKKDINIMYLTFIEKSEYENFVNSRVKVEGGESI